jgi:hypothetical protein
VSDAYRAVRLSDGKRSLTSFEFQDYEKSRAGFDPSQALRAMSPVVRMSGFIEQASCPSLGFSPFAESRVAVWLSIRSGNRAKY